MSAGLLPPSLQGHPLESPHPSSSPHQRSRRDDPRNSDRHNAGRECSTVNVCGHARNAYTSNRNIAVKCQNGDWWWVKPATDDPCKDVVKVKIPTTGKTWMLVHTERLNGSEWVLMNQGAYVGVSDGQTKRFKTRKP